MSQIPDHLPAHVSLDLFGAMREYISSHPNWDHYRLLQAAVAGFLFQGQASHTGRPGLQPSHYRARGRNRTGIPSAG
jgi:hypothetical protein